MVSWTLWPPQVKRFVAQALLQLPAIPAAVEPAGPAAAAPDLDRQVEGSVEESPLQADGVAEADGERTERVYLDASADGERYGSKVETPSDAAGDDEHLNVGGYVAKDACSWSQEGSYLAGDRVAYRLVRLYYSLVPIGIGFSQVEFERSAFTDTWCHGRGEGSTCIQFRS